MGCPLPSPYNIQLDAATPQLVPPEETQDEKAQDTGPQVVKVYIKGMIALRPDSYIFP